MADSSPVNRVLRPIYELGMIMTALREAKIICTLGPSCWSVDGIVAMLDAGMDVARLDFSHFDIEVSIFISQKNTLNKSV